MRFELVIRPFLYSPPGKPSAAYELVLIRSEGSRVYDRRIAIISGTDCRDICLACPDIKFIRNS